MFQKVNQLTKVIMNIYLVYEFSKGRRDLVFVSSTLELAVSSAIEWSKNFPNWHYRIYAVGVDTQTFYVNELDALYTF